MKNGAADPKSRLRDISREVAQRAGELRGMHPSRREPERSGHRRPESRYRGGFADVKRCGTARVCVAEPGGKKKEEGRTEEKKAFHFFFFFPGCLCNRLVREQCVRKGIKR